MNKQELQEELSFLFEPNAIIGLELYLVLKTDEGLELRLADLGDGNLPTEIKNGFLDYVKGRTFQNDDAKVLPLSEFNNEQTTIHHYNLDGLPLGLEIIQNELDAQNIEFFNFNDDELENVDAFLIKLSSVEKKVILYKKHFHLNLLKQSKVLYFVNDKQRFVKPKEGVLRFSFTIDFMRIKDKIMVYDIKCLEREFRFDSIIINNAQQKVNVIASLNFVDNIEELHEFANEKSGASKILALKPNSPVLALQFSQIKTFVQNHPYLVRRFRFNEDESMFHFHTLISRQYFIDLLNDNFLTSDLTSIFYKTNTKLEMEGEQEESEN